MKAATLSEIRRFVHPGGDDTWESIAQRELGNLPPAEAVQKLQSWNLHVFMRPKARIGTARAGNPILPSDVIFVEAPLT